MNPFWSEYFKLLKKIKNFSGFWSLPLLSFLISALFRSCSNLNKLERRLKYIFFLKIQKFSKIFTQLKQVWRRGRCKLKQNLVKDGPKSVLLWTWKFLNWVKLSLNEIKERTKVRKSRTDSGTDFGRSLGRRNGSFRTKINWTSEVLSIR